MNALILMLFLVSCTSHMPLGKPKEGKATYSYTDESGTYRYVREAKLVQKKIITRNQLIETKGGATRVLEKSIVVSQLGSIKNGKNRLVTVRPSASEFTVWLEGKKYSSKMRINPKRKSMLLSLESPDPRWQGDNEVSFPRGKYFCFFNQIPECLYHNYLLSRANENRSERFDFYVIWDSYPFVQEQYARTGKNLFAAASVKFDGEIKKLFRYIVEVEGQIILYQFSKSMDLVKIAWISQGITVAPPGEEVQDEE